MNTVFCHWLNPCHVEVWWFCQGVEYLPSQVWRLDFSSACQPPLSKSKLKNQEKMNRQTLLLCNRCQQSSSVCIFFILRRRSACLEGPRFVDRLCNWFWLSARGGGHLCNGRGLGHDILLSRLWNGCYFSSSTCQSEGHLWHTCRCFTSLSHGAWSEQW